MVRYVILRRLLHEIPTLVSFRNTRFSAWFTLPEGYLRGVKLPIPAPWSPDLKPAQLDDDASTIALEDSYPELQLDNENDNWPDDDYVDDNAPSGEPSYHHTDPPSQPPPDTILDTSNRVRRVPVIPARTRVQFSARM